MIRRIAPFAVAWLLLGIAAGPSHAQLLNPFSSYWDNVAHSAAKDDAGAVQRLLMDGKSPNGTDDDGHSALHIAAMNGNMRISAMLVKAGATIGIKDSLGNTPLFYAADRDHIDVVKLLLDAGAPVDDQNRSGVTPLMAAARHGNTEAVRLLLAKGASATKTDYTGRDAVGWAQDSHRQGLVQLLRQDSAGHR